MDVQSEYLHHGGDCRMAGIAGSCTVMISLLAVGGMIFYAVNRQ